MEVARSGGLRSADAHEAPMSECEALAIGLAWTVQCGFNQIRRLFITNQIEENNNSSEPGSGMGVTKKSSTEIPTLLVPPALILNSIVWTPESVTS
jgi:hypothetical protein